MGYVNCREKAAERHKKVFVGIKYHRIVLSYCRIVVVPYFIVNNICIILHIHTPLQTCKSLCKYV